MKKQLIVFILFGLAVSISAQETIPLKNKQSHEVKQAFEAESLFPMFLTGGYHFALGYRYERWRVRVSIINGGSYNAERAGINNSADDFKRYYKTAPGLFFGYNVWKNLDIYTFIEAHKFEIEQKGTGVKKDMRSLDFGGGIGYQFFIWRNLYIQPAVHIYLRKDKSLDFDQVQYNIPNMDISPVLRIGYRIWSK